MKQRSCTVNKTSAEVKQTEQESCDRLLEVEAGHATTPKFETVAQPSKIKNWRTSVTCQGPQLIVRDTSLGKEAPVVTKTAKKGIFVFLYLG